MVSRAAQSVVGKLGRTLEEAAGALADRRHRPRRARRCSAARGIDDDVDALEAMLPAASETARFSPTRRGDRDVLRRYEQTMPQVDFAVRNARVLARYVLRHTRGAEPAPDGLPLAVRELADAVWELGAQYDAARAPDASCARSRSAPPATRRRSTRASLAGADADRRPGALDRRRPRARRRAARPSPDAPVWDRPTEELLAVAA